MKELARSFIRNFKGKKLSHPILVFESDDWGAQRMPCQEARAQLLELNYEIENCPYNSVDSLETAEDVNLLSELLSRHQNAKGETPIFTLNYLSANPDFEKIKECNFENYYSKGLSESYHFYQNTTEALEEVKRGINNNLFQVQFHGREHLNVARWMRALRKGDQAARDAFEVGVYSPKVAPLGYAMEYMDALDYDDEESQATAIAHLKLGWHEFEQNWGFKSQTFIAPCYRWDHQVEAFLSEQELLGYQGQRAQLHPQLASGYSQDLIPHYNGQKNEQGQIYTVRNVFFEPAIVGEKALDLAWSQIRVAFAMGSPAIICSHRLNFSGVLKREMRDRNLNLLDTLLQRVSKKYPQVDFLSSDQLIQRFL